MVIPTEIQPEVKNMHKYLKKTLIISVFILTAIALYENFLLVPEYTGLRVGVSDYIISSGLSTAIFMSAISQIRHGDSD